MDAPHLFVRARFDHELGLFVREPAPRGQVLLALHRSWVRQPGVRTFSMEKGVFLRSPSDLHCLVRHACTPTAFIDWTEPAICALRQLAVNDEITLNYHAIYDEVPSPFLCHCGAPECHREIRGFRHLTLDQKLSLEIYLSPHLKRILNEEVLAMRATAG